MSPNQVVAPGVREALSGFGVDFANVGNVLVYTTPANRRAEVTAFVAVGQGATTDVQPQYVTGANAITVADTAAGSPTRQSNVRIMLDAGDTFRWRVTAGTALDTGDVYMGVMEEA